MTNRVVNFNAGPSGLPLAALERAQKEFLDYQGTGMSIMEHSHRGKDYEAVHNEAIKLLTDLLGVPDTHQVLFLQGGASHQFAMLPMNLRTDEHAGDYVITGAWSQKAYDEAKIVGKPAVAADTSVEGKFTRVPKQSELKLSPNAPYVHITSNNTIFGTQFFDFPTTGNVPLIADMSSDILWRPTDVSKFGMIYAGAQKNIGPSGVTVVIMRKDLIEKSRKDIPKVLRYSTHAKENSLYNTAPTFAIYMVRNVLAVLKEQGGLPAIEKQNRKKGEILYAAIDGSGGYYKCPVEKDSRSVMNVVFRLPSEALEDKFVSEAKKAGMVGLKGHRSVGGIRASQYNAVTVEGVQKLVDFMSSFHKANG
ncbi:MAG TPA: 3-phosphoserine/phosphohydroxythreonine transaminase [Polyangiales bacterium]